MTVGKFLTDRFLLLMPTQDNTPRSEHLTSTYHCKELGDKHKDHVKISTNKMWMSGFIRTEYTKCMIQIVKSWEIDNSVLSYLSTLTNVLTLPVRYPRDQNN